MSCEAKRYRLSVRRPAVLAATFLLLCALFFAIAGCGGKADSAKPGPIKSWGKDGVVRLGNFEADRMIEDGSGRVLVLGLYDDRIAEIVRLLPDGSLDPSFGTGGVVRWPYRMFVDRFPLGRHFLGWDMAAFLHGGRIALAGTNNFGDINQQSTLIVSEIDESGHTIRSFGENGYFISKMSNCLRGPTGMAVQDGRVVVAANRFCAERQPNRIMLMRLTPNGKLDTAFARGGRLTVVKSRSDALLSPDTFLLTLPQNRLALMIPGASGGTVEIRGLLENGNPDMNFGRKGTASARVAFDSSTDVRTTGLYRDRKGNLTIAGSTFAGPFLVRFDRSGDAANFWTGSPWEPSLTGSETNYENFGGAFGRRALFAQRKDGGFYVAGAVLARVNQDGVIRSSYPTQVLYDSESPSRTVKDLLVSEDGTAFVSLTTYNSRSGVSTTFIARYR
jgi:hypothetical protein